MALQICLRLQSLTATCYYRQVGWLACNCCSSAHVQTCKCAALPHRNFHALKYLDGLAEAITKHGGRIFEETRVREMKGLEVRARAAPLARCYCNQLCYEVVLTSAKQPGLLCAAVESIAPCLAHAEAHGCL